MKKLNVQANFKAFVEKVTGKSKKAAEPAAAEAPETAEAAEEEEADEAEAPAEEAPTVEAPDEEAAKKPCVIRRVIAGVLALATAAAATIYLVNKYKETGFDLSKLPAPDAILHAKKK